MALPASLVRQLYHLKVFEKVCEQLNKTNPKLDTLIFVFSLTHTQSDSWTCLKNVWQAKAKQLMSIYPKLNSGQYVITHRCISVILVTSDYLSQKKKKKIL